MSRAVLAVVLVAFFLNAPAFGVSQCDDWRIAVADWGLMVIFLLPVIIVKSYLLARRLGLARRDILKPVTIGSAASAVLAVPITILLICAVWAVTVGQGIWHDLVDGGFPWNIDPGLITWTVGNVFGWFYVAAIPEFLVIQAAIFAPVFVISCVFELLALKQSFRQVKVFDLVLALIMANLATVLPFVFLPTFALYPLFSS